MEVLARQSSQPPSQSQCRARSQQATLHAEYVTKRTLPTHWPREPMDLPGRRYLCAGCRTAVLVCSHCDRGHRYCKVRCGNDARRRSVRATAGDHHPSQRAIRARTVSCERKYNNRSSASCASPAKRSRSAPGSGLLATGGMKLAHCACHSGVRAKSACHHSASVPGFGSESPTPPQAALPLVSARHAGQTPAPPPSRGIRAARESAPTSRCTACGTGSNKTEARLEFIPNRGRGRARSGLTRVVSAMKNAVTE